MQKTILKYALKNAHDFQGKINVNVVLGLVLKENPELKKDFPALQKEIAAVIKTVEKMSAAEISAKLKQEFPELLKDKSEDKEVVKGLLKPLPNAKKGQFVVRIAPSPSGPLHVGHAYGICLNSEYAKMYSGKFILRIEDTNPENIYPDAYRLIEEDVRWLTGNQLDKIVVQSSRLGIYYDYAEKLVQAGQAYVCICNEDAAREMKKIAQACPCRELNSKEQNIRYAKMFNGYKEGEAVLKLKTNINDENPAMRDFPIMRINEHIHPKTGTANKVWPLMVFSVAIDDHELGITHVLNGKDHLDNGKKESIIMELLGWKAPVYQHWGRFNFIGMHLSTSETRRQIEQGEYTGWDDIRIPFLQALKKRGYQPGAFHKFAMEVGLSSNDKTVSKEEFWKMIDSFNRDIIEAKANRYFFVDDAVRIQISGAPTKNVEIPLHPEYPNRGMRKFAARSQVYIALSDFQKLGEDYVHRLMDFCNFKLVGKTFQFVSESYDDYKNAHDKGRIIHWIPSDSYIEMEILQENGRVLHGLGESTIQQAKEGEIVQFERRFFATIQKKEKDIIRCWYLHK